MRFVEDTKETWTAIQLEAVEKEIEQQKREWEANRLAELQREEEERKRQEAEENNLLTYSREDSKNQVNNNKLSTKKSKNRSPNARNNALNSSRRANLGSGNISQVKNAKNREGNTRNLRKSVTVTPNNKKVSPKKVVQSPPKTTTKKLTKRSPVKINHKNQRKITPNKKPPSRKRDSSVASTQNTSDSESEAESKNVKNDVSDDSECSLDVMIDTTDDPDSDSNQASTNGAVHRPMGSEADHESAEETEESDKGMRRTRSRGTVKINLWSLDPNPEVSLRRSGGKSSPGKLKNRTPQMSSTRKRARIDEETTASETGSDTGSRSNTPKLKNLKILIQKHDEVKKVTTPNRSKLHSNKKLKISPGLNLSKNHNTLDNWVKKTPKISLTLEDQEACKRASASEHSDSGTPDHENAENGVEMQN